MKHRNAGPRPRKKTPYELCDQELKTEKSELAKRKSLKWKKKQQQRLKKNTDVIDARMILRKMPPKKSTNKGSRITTQESTTYKAKKKPIEILSDSKTEECCMLCLGKRQQTSSAVMFARLRSKSRYNPGD